MADYNVGDRAIPNEDANQNNAGLREGEIPLAERLREGEANVVRPQAGVIPNAAMDNEWREQGQGEAEEANWNPMEWDRPAEELTWERLLGLDGSLLFLEHVFWVISLNTLFIMVRAAQKIHFFNKIKLILINYFL